MLKTYYVRGYIEWTAALNAGKAVVNIPFTGGAFTKYGHTPARFSTADTSLQKLIENSAPYRQGKIRPT